MGTDWKHELASALEWWRDAGVDTLVEADPRDWLARPAPKPAVAAAAPEAPPAPALPEILPDTLDAFVAWRTSDDAPEAEWLSPRVTPKGPADAALMVLVDMPEAGDAESGLLLGGAPGRLFDQILAAIGESRESVYLAPYAWARPVTGMIPPETESRLGQLARHHVALVAPKRLLLLGKSANGVRATTNGSAPGNSKGDINPIAGDLDLVAIEHPRFLLEQPVAKARAWKQLVRYSGGSNQ